MEGTILSVQPHHSKQCTSMYTIFQWKHTHWVLCAIALWSTCLVLLSDVSCFTVVHAGAFLYDGKGSNMLVSFILSFAWEADVRPLYEKRTHIKKYLQGYGIALFCISKNHFVFANSVAHRLHCMQHSQLLKQSSSVLQTFKGLLGVTQYGVHVNGFYKSDDGGLHMWIAKRSPTKQTWPGKLDQLVSLTWS